MVSKNKAQPNFYWDSCVFLAWINGEAERIETIEALHHHICNDLKGRIMTSALSIAEVAKSREESRIRITDSAVLDRLDAMWSDPALTMVEAARPIMMAARDLIRSGISHGTSLKPPDAIHLATARYLEKNGILITEFHTYDTHLINYGSHMGIPMCTPYHEPQPRQTNFFDDME